MADFDFRRLVEADLEETLDLVWETFLRFEAPDYAPEGVAAFGAFIRLENFREQFLAEGFFAWGCFVGERMVGMIALRNIHHVTLFFVEADFHQQGIGKRLFALAKEQVRQEGATRMTVNSSPYAVVVYEKLGFVRTGAMETKDGIQFLPMEMRL